MGEQRANMIDSSPHGIVDLSPPPQRSEIIECIILRQRVRIDQRLCLRLLFVLRIFDIANRERIPSYVRFTIRFSYALSQSQSITFANCSSLVWSRTSITIPKMGKWSA